MIPEGPDLLRLAAEADVNQRTVQRAYRGDPIRDSSRRRIEAAAKRLRVSPPPPSTSK